MVKYSAGIAAKSSSLPMGGNVRTMVLIRFKEARENKTIEIDAPVGKTLLEIALDNDVDIEGACGGELACSTCHVVMDKKLYDSLPEKKEEEDDMLDLAWGLTDT